MKRYTYIVTSDIWGADITVKEHVAACRRMEAWLTEHEGEELSISVRPETWPATCATVEKA